MIKLVFFFWFLVFMVVGIWMKMDDLNRQGRLGDMIHPDHRTRYCACPDRSHEVNQ